MSAAVTHTMYLTLGVSNDKLPPIQCIVPNFMSAAVAAVTHTMYLNLGVSNDKLPRCTQLYVSCSNPYNVLNPRSVQ